MAYLSESSRTAPIGRIGSVHLKRHRHSVDINNTADNNQVVKDPKKWDVYAMANVQAPTGDPEYWFTVFAVSYATKNQGKYHSAKLDALEEQLSQEFDPAKRAALAVQMQQTVLDDNAFVFCSFLKMSMISKKKRQELYLPRLRLLPSNGRPGHRINLYSSPKIGTTKKQSIPHSSIKQPFTF